MDSNEMKRRRGRPKKAGAFIDRYTFRMTQEDIDMMDDISSDRNIRWSEIIRRALKFYHNNWKREKGYY